ncbi:B-cell receptor CD22-like isoform X2 [Polyodon spathula]|uniref:B-cell receptor CD22-like isoform X2 n=1 Tax=Polyodon spathula TaxID=7913 RepID=UPI001B7F24B5|nr:B-cell receptor CD22-like isoform X2 [Polyodon spathula]
MLTVETHCMLVVSLHFVLAVQGDDFGVNYPAREMCALRGSSVVIPCTYYYPKKYWGTTLTVVTVKWFRSTARCATDSNTYVYHSTGTNVSTEYKQRTEYPENKVKNCTLKIRDLKSSDTGRYCFRFETNHRSAKWTDVTGVSLSIREPKVTLDHPGPDNTVKEGSLVSLTCSFVHCNLRESSIVWYKEGQLIGNEKSTKLQFNVSYEDSGKYGCASAENSSIKSEEINLIVKYAPKNTSVSITAPGGIVEGSSVTLTCTSTADPPVSSYAWFRRDGNGNKEKAHNKHLNFSRISSSDSGDYYCEANNSLGTQSSPSVPLSVTGVGMNMLVYAVAGSVAVIILLILVIIICIKKKKKDQPIGKVNVKSEGGNQESTGINTIYVNVLPSTRGTQDYLEEMEGIHYGAIRFQEKNQPHAPIEEKNIPLQDSIIYSTVAKPVI